MKPVTVEMSDAVFPSQDAEVSTANLVVAIGRKTRP